MSRNIKLPSPGNLVIASKSRYPVRPGDSIDWSAKLFDEDGWEHRLIDLGAVQVVTKISFAYAIWDRRTGRCLSHDCYAKPISNRPLTDAERHQKHLAATEALHQMMQTTA